MKKLTDEESRWHDEFHALATRRDELVAGLRECELQLSGFPKIVSGERADKKAQIKSDLADLRTALATLNVRYRAMKPTHDQLHHKEPVELYANYDVLDNEELTRVFWAVLRVVSKRLRNGVDDDPHPMGDDEDDLTQQGKED